MNNYVIWGIHAGSLGQVDKYFLSKTNPCVAIGWHEIGDLSKIENDRDKFKEELVKDYPSIKKDAI